MGTNTTLNTTEMKKIAAIGMAFVMMFSFSACRTKVPEAPVTTNSEKVTLTFWNLFDDSDIFKGQIQSYQSKHPNVTIQYRKFTQVDEYESFLINEIAEGEGPDIFAIHNSWVDRHEGKITPFPIGKTTVPLNAQIFEDTFFHVASEDLIRDGEILALPMYIDTLALYYNKQHFRDNIPSSDKPADTWEEIKNQVAQLTKENNSIERFALSGIAMGRGDNIQRAKDIFSALLIQFGTQMFNDAGDKAVFAQKQGTVEGTGKAYYPFTEALRLFSSFGNPSFKNYTWNNAITAQSKEDKELNPFLRGKVSMIAGYSYLYDDLISMRKQMKTVGETVIDEGDIGVVEFPQILSFAESGKRDAYADYFPLTVSRNSEHADYAWDFLQFLTSQESLTDYYERTHKPSSRKDLVDEQMVAPIYGVFARQASYAKSLFHNLPVFPEFLNTIFDQVLDDAIKNKSTLEDISLKAQEKVNCQIEKQERFGEVSTNCLDL